MVDLTDKQHDTQRKNNKDNPRYVSQNGSRLAALTDSSIDATIDATKVAIQLDDTIGAVAGESLRAYATTDCYLAWGATEAAAGDAALASKGVAEKIAHDGFGFAKGTEIITIPAQLTGEIWLGAIQDTASGKLSVSLID